MFFCLSLYFTFIYLYSIVIYILRLLYVIRVHILIVKYHRDLPKVFPSSQFYTLPNNEKRVVEKHKVYYLHITNHSTNKNVFTRNQHVAYIDKVIKVFRNTYSITVHQRNLKCLVHILTVLL